MSESTDMSSTKKQQDENDDEIQILEENQQNFDVAFKLIIIGNSGVGKSCLSTRATKKTFNEDYFATIGFEYFIFNIKFLKDNFIVRLHIWDTCGQEIYRSLVSNYYKNSSLAIMVYDINE